MFNNHLQKGGFYAEIASEGVDMTGAQLEAILKLSVGIEINKMYYKKYNLDKDEALEIISDM